ncbi:MAG TPA: HAMP domain-containing sensor histidine kinase [Mobilitalea sp.]|nr:HAMP domain-containing sensor histidine kinase [Mobilitalea sp.]
MVLKKYKSNTLFWLFLKQILMLSFSILLEIIAFILLFNIGLNSGFILPANYSEHYLEQNKNTISGSEPFDKSLIPHTCKYGLFDFNGNYLSGNFSKDVVDGAKVLIKDANAANDHYFLIERANGYCVVKYDIAAHFSSDALHKLFPKLELMLIVLFILIFAVIIINNAFLFDKKLKKEFRPVLEEIAQIQTRELNIKQKNSRIKEINDILVSLYDMEIALSQSLKKEWETEQKRKGNISALAHDIKTPLTIIKGNSELIMEEDNIAEIYQFAEIINNYSDKIEKYLKLLIDETKNNLSDDKEEKTNLAIVITDIITESEALCKINCIELLGHNTVSDREVVVNKDSIVRAVVNLVKNASEHTISNRKIELRFKYFENKFIAEIEDYGKGFTSEALKYAKNQFYTEKSERSEEHYGLGMNYANNVAEKYNGSITYYNKPSQTGAVVTFEINI